MPYTQNQKATGLDPLVPISTSLVVMGDPADSGRAKKSTIAQVAQAILTYIQTSLGGLVQSVTGLNTNNADPKNPIVQISVDGVTITGAGTPASPLVATGGGSGGAGSSGKAKSYSLEGLLGVPIRNGYTNIESYITSSGPTVYAEIDPNFLQVWNTTSDWADADQVNSYVVTQGYLYLLLQDTAVNDYRVYRYDANNIASGGTLMTIAVQAFGTQNLMVMASDGTDFFFNYLAGNSASDFDVSRYTVSGTTLTWASDVALGAIANASDVFIVASSGNYYGLNVTGTREVKEFDPFGTLLNTYGPYDANYTNIINWTDTLYIAKSAGDDEAYRITVGTTGGGTLVGQDPTQLFASTGGTATQSYTIQVPGGTLGTRGNIRYRVIISTLLLQTGGTTVFSATYGGSSVGTTGTISCGSTSPGINDARVVIEGVIMANASTGAQKGHLSAVLHNSVATGGAADVYAGYAAASVNSTVQQPLVFTFTVTNNDQVTSQGIVVERVN